MSCAKLFLYVVIVGAAETPEKGTPDVRCGSYCLYVALKALDVGVPNFDDFERKMGAPSSEGYSMAQLEQTARGYGVNARGVSTSIEQLVRRPGQFACIALINQNHFVLVGDVDDRGVHIIDAPHERTIPRDTFRSEWKGEALLLSVDPLLPEESLPRSFPWGVLMATLAAGAVAFFGWRIWSLRRRRSEGVLGLILVCLAFVGCAAKEKGVPKVSVPEAFVDLGVRNPAVDTDCIAEFVLRNVGTESLEILRTESSCGCAVVQGTLAPIPAGGAGTLRIALTQRSTTGGSASVHVTTNDPEQPTITLGCLWKWRHPVSVKEPILDFGVVSPGKIEERTVELVGNASDFPGIAWIVHEQRELSAKLDEASGMLGIRLEASEEPGIRTGFVSARRTQGDQWQLMEIRWIVQSPVVISPAAVSFGSGNAGEKKVLLVRLKAAKGGALEILPPKLETNLGAVHATMIRNNAEEATVELEFTFPIASGVFKDVLTIESVKPVAGTWRVPIFAIVKKPSEVTATESAR